jgi:hypothetical protein
MYPLPKSIAHCIQSSYSFLQILKSALDGLVIQDTYTSLLFDFWNFDKVLP